MNYEERLQDLLDELDLFQDWTERYEYIISLGKKLPPLEKLPPAWEQGHKL